MIRRVIKTLVDRAVVPAFRIKPMRVLLTYLQRSVTYEQLKGIFVQNGQDTPWDVPIRQEIANRFELIDRQIPLATTSTDGLFMAEAPSIRRTMMRLPRHLFITQVNVVLQIEKAR